MARPEKGLARFWPKSESCGKRNHNKLTVSGTCQKTKFLESRRSTFVMHKLTEASQSGHPKCIIPVEVDVCDA